MSQPIKSQANKSQPIKSQQIKIQPNKSQPKKSQPIKSQPTKGHQIRVMGAKSKSKLEMFYFIFYQLVQPKIEIHLCSV